jgi:hypothetical protein
MQALTILVQHVVYRSPYCSKRDERYSACKSTGPSVNSAFIARRASSARSHCMLWVVILVKLY